MKKILIIEDSEEVRCLVNDLLSTHDFHVVEAENGRVGVETAEREMPDLILCDLHMPELDGFGVLRQLRSKPGTASIPFVFLTGMVDQPLLRQSMELGADDLLTKPFTFDELLCAVRSRLR